VGSNVIKWRIPVLLTVSLLIVPAFLAQSKTDFTYGFGEPAESTRSGKDTKTIDESFGKHSQLVVLVPRGDIAREELLVQRIEQMSQVTSVVAYINAVGAAIPSNFLEKEITESFFSENYSRIIIQANTDLEGDVAFLFLEEVRETVSEYFESDTYMLGESATLYDMKQVIEKDNTLVNLLTVLTIALVLVITFKSFSYPIILLLTIQSSVWINLSVPYFTDSPLVYIGYLIISTVQLAATVDYAILMSEDYTNKRKIYSAKVAIVKTINEKTYSIAVSASILSSVGFILWFTSTNPIVAAIGLLLGRGALLAFLMVLFLLPGLLIVFDKVIEKTTW